MADEQETRINKFLSEVGYCSRRAADKLIAAGRVTINGVVPEVGTKVGPADEVCVDGKPVRQSEEARVYLAFNKPLALSAPPIPGLRRITSSTSSITRHAFFRLAVWISRARASSFLPTTAIS